MRNALLISVRLSKWCKVKIWAHKKRLIVSIAHLSDGNFSALPETHISTTTGWASIAKPIAVCLRLPLKNTHTTTTARQCTVINTHLMFAQHKWQFFLCRQDRFFYVICISLSSLEMPSCYCSPVRMIPKRFYPTWINAQWARLVRACVRAFVRSSPYYAWVTIIARNSHVRAQVRCSAPEFVVGWALVIRNDIIIYTYSYSTYVYVCTVQKEKNRIKK